MRISSSFKHHSTGISLVILAIGFVSLGLLELINRPQRDFAAGTLLENNGSVIGSIVSIFAGAIFLVAALIYWSRPSAVTTTQNQNEQPRSMTTRAQDFWWPLTTAPAEGSSFKKSSTETKAIRPMITKAS
jgi:hypothetical protein